MKRILLVTTLASAVILAGCATAPNSANVYQSRQVHGEQSVRMGTVESVRNVTINAGQSGMGVGTLGGAALGGLAGSTIGKGRGSVAAAVGGAIAGGIIGQKLEQGASTKAGLEITVRLDRGGHAAITQDADVPFYVGDRVRLLSDGGTTRVTH
ncbi:MAG: rane protein [Solimicrobium sp.]|nr:rane protein [Solimicrobium sp.]